MRVFDVSGDRLNQTVSHTGSGPGDLHWDVFSGQFTALQTTTSLEFTSLSDSSGHTGGIMLDGAQVTLPLQARLTQEASSATLNWMGVLPPYRVRRATGLTPGDWVDILPNAVPPVTLPLQQSTEFYRIVGQ